MNYFNPVKTLTKASVATSLALGLLIAQPSVGSIAPAYAQGPTSVADLAEGLMPAVVNISTSQKVKNQTRNIPIPKVPEGSPFQDFFNDLFPNGPNGGQNKNSPRTRNSLGSGFVIDAKGIIITNNHVIADADEITVNFSDGSKLSAEVVGKDPKTDIAVLKVDPDGKELTAVPLGNSSDARIGDWVMAIGNPFGLGGSVSLGIVSAVERDISSGPYDNFIQTDAAINRGNSGGPLFNMDGEVVGINTAIISPSGGSIGIGFSIPSDLATRVIDQLVEFGETRRGWLGVQIQSVSDEIAESLGLTAATGALVSGLVKDGPAEASGLKSGDVILVFDGKDVTEMRDLPIIVADTDVNKEVDVVVWRKGEQQTVKVTLGRLEDGEKKLTSLTTGNDDAEEKDEPATETLLGLTLSEITDETREDAKLSDDTSGLFINEVEGGSAAQDKGIRAGEVIVQIGQEPVATLSDAKNQVAALKQEGRKNALLMVSTPKGDIRFVVVAIE